MSAFQRKKSLLKKLYGLFLWLGFSGLKSTNKATVRRQFTLDHKVPRSSWYSFNRPKNDEKQSQS